MVDKNWSFSKYMTFENCPKILWFEENSNSRSKFVIPLYSLIGTSVHKAISFFVLSWSKNVIVSDREVKRIGIEFIRDVWKNRNKTIIEFFNGTVKDNSLCSKFENSFTTFIDNFFLYIWPTFANEKYVTHEKLFTLRYEDFNILVKPDLITRDMAGNLVITDWKTSVTHDNSTESFQVSSYGFWASHFYNIEPERIILQIINLRTGKRIRDKFSKEKIEETISVINSQIDELKNFSHEEIPQAKPEIKKCKMCVYLRICEDGKGLLMDI